MELAAAGASIEETARVLNMDRAEVSASASRLGVPFQKQLLWSDDAVVILMEQRARGALLSEAARVLGRPNQEVCEQAKLQGLSAFATREWHVLTEAHKTQLRHTATEHRTFAQLVVRCPSLLPGLGVNG